MNASWAVSSALLGSVIILLVFILAVENLLERARFRVRVMTVVLLSLIVALVTSGGLSGFTTSSAVSTERSPPASSNEGAEGAGR